MASHSERIRKTNQILLKEVKWIMAEIKNCLPQNYDGDTTAALGLHEMRPDQLAVTLTQYGIPNVIALRLAYEGPIDHGTGRYSGRKVMGRLADKRRATYK